MAAAESHTLIRSNHLLLEFKDELTEAPLALRELGRVLLVELDWDSPRESANIASLNALRNRLLVDREREGKPGSSMELVNDPGTVDYFMGRIKEGEKVPFRRFTSLKSFYDHIQYDPKARKMLLIPLRQPKRNTASKHMMKPAMFVYRDLPKEFLEHDLVKHNQAHEKSAGKDRLSLHYVVFNKVIIGYVEAWQSLAAAETFYSAHAYVPAANLSMSIAQSLHSHGPAASAFIGRFKSLGECAPALVQRARLITSYYRDLFKGIYDGQRPK